MPAKSAIRNNVFVSYSHADKKWLERLKVHIKPLERDHNLVIWNDAKFRSSYKWQTEINKVLASAKVAILLVSADYLAADFIYNNELPPLLKAAERKGMFVLPLIVGSCSFTLSPLSQFQAVNDHKQPLNLILKEQADEIYLQLIQRIYGIFNPIRVKRNLALKSFRVQNFKGIRNVEVDDLPPSAKWILLTGENGYGKTSILQAIAAGLKGNYDESGQQLIPDFSTIEVEYFSDGEIVVNSSETSHKLLSLARLDRELATYGSSRLQISAEVTKEMIERQKPTTYPLFNTNASLLNIEQRLKDSYKWNRSDFNQILTVFQQLLPQLANIQIQEINKIPEIRYFEQDENGNLINTGVSFSELAAGLKSIIAMIGDLIYRLSTRQEVDQLRDLQGIVIIDELELHLHPKYQKLLPEKLTQLFPNIQFIASTHSPIPLLGVPAETVLLHVTRDAEKGIQVERLEVDFTVLTPNAILSSPIFGFHDIIPETAGSPADVATEDTFDEAEHTKRLKAKLKILKAKLNQD
jgi:AAA15 family ATPase/GTPase